MFASLARTPSLTASPWQPASGGGIPALAPVIRGIQSAHSDPPNPQACDWQGGGGGRVRGRGGPWRMPERSTRATPETRERRGDSYSLAHCLAHSRCLVSGYSISHASCSHQLPPNFPTPSIPRLVSCMGGHPPDLGPLCLTLPAVLPSWGPVSAQLASMPTPPPPPACPSRPRALSCRQTGDTSPVDLSSPV